MLELGKINANKGDKIMSKNKVGRPKGHKLSEASKSKIAKSKTGYVTPIETKDKISDTLKNYWLSDVGLSRKPLLINNMKKGE